MTDSKDYLFASALEKFKSHLEHTSVTRRFRRDTIAFGPVYGNNHAALGWMELPFRTAIEAVERLCPQVSKRSIRQELLEVTIQLFEQADIDDTTGEGDVDVESVLAILGSSDIEAQFIAIIDRLRSRVQTGITAYIPISGLELKVREFQIGNITLYPVGHGPLLPILERLETLGEKQELRDHKGCYAAVPGLMGDFNYVYETAATRLLPAIDILNFYLAKCHHRRTEHARISIGNHLPSTTLVYVDTPSGGYGYEGKLTGHLWYGITTELIDQWTSSGLEDIIRCCLNQLSPKTIEARVKRAVTWYSKAINADNPDEQFIALTTSLESLLVGDEGKSPTASWGSIAQRLADRVAFLLGADYEARRDLVQTVKRLYNTRSKTVHSGEPISPQDVDCLDRIVFEAIVAFVQNAFTIWDDFLDWTYKQMYAVPINGPSL